MSTLLAISRKCFLQKGRVASLVLPVDFAIRADWVVLGHGTNVTRVTRGENIFNNKIYIGDLASMSDVRRPAAMYRGEYQQVLATGVTLYFEIEL